MPGRAAPREVLELDPEVEASPTIFNKGPLSDANATSAFVTWFLIVAYEHWSRAVYGVYSIISKEVLNVVEPNIHR